MAKSSIMRLSETEIIPMTDRALKTEHTDPEIERKIQNAIAIMEHEGFEIDENDIEWARSILTGELDGDAEIDVIVQRCLANKSSKAN